MTVKRIVTNIAADRIKDAEAFYSKLLGLNLVMDNAWIMTFASDEVTSPQISIASEGGSGTQVPDISIEVDNVDEVYQQAISANFQILYEIINEPWGVRRFYVQDPFGKTINIMSHIDN